MYEEQGPDDMKSEFPSCLEECFYSSLEGSYFKAELSKARDEKRIGLPLPYDPTRVVNTFWDIGVDDENVIWFHQTDGVRHRLIDLYRGPAALHSGDPKALGLAVPPTQRGRAATTASITARTTSAR